MPVELLSRKASLALRKESQAVAKSAQSNQWKLGELISKVSRYRIRHDQVNVPLFKEWGYASMALWADAELGINRRTAERFRSTWEFYEITMKGKWNRANFCGHHKMRLLIPFINGVDNINRILAWGKKASCRDIEAQYDRTVEAVKSDKTLDFYVISANTTRKEIRSIEKAIDLARDINDDKRKGALIAQICAFYLESGKDHIEAAQALGIGS